MNVYLCRDTVSHIDRTMLSNSIRMGILLHRLFDTQKKHETNSHTNKNWVALIVRKGEER